MPVAYPADTNGWRESTAARKEKNFDKLQGVSSLKIQLQDTPEAAGNTLTFRSLARSRNWSSRWQTARGWTPWAGAWRWRWGYGAWPGPIARRERRSPWWWE